MFRALKNWFPGQRPAKAARRDSIRPARGGRLGLELLEDRLMPAQLTVLSALDPAPPTAGTLRYAVAQADTDAAHGISDTIVFDSVQMGSGKVTLARGPLELTAGPGTVTIDGGGQVAVSGNHASTVFQIDSGAHAALTGLTIQDGNGSFGGGVSNAGTLAITNATLSGNSVTGFYCGGGGIYNSGTLTLSNATLVGNFAKGFAGNGGGIMNMGTLTVGDATLFGNSAMDDGGGIYSRSAYGLPMSVLTMQGTIVAGNSAAYADPDVYGGVATGSSHNLIGDGTGLFGISNGDAYHNQVGSSASPINPRLAPLGNYGGSMQTLALLAGSPAIGAGVAVPGIATDQRGVPRTYPGDIGAYQSPGGTPLVPTRFTVTTASDLPGHTGTSLRDALALADAAAAVGISDTIVFDTTRMGGATITLAQGALELTAGTGTVTIDGGGTVTLSGAGRGGVFGVDLGASASLTGLTIRDGNAFAGGAIANAGTLAVADTTLTGNVATFQWGYGGGAIYNTGTLTVADSTLTGNSALANGGAIENLGVLAVTGTTISGNSAMGALGDGGGIFNRGTLTVTDSTIAGNTAPGSYGSGGGICNFGGPLSPVTLQNTVIVANSAAYRGPDISGQVAAASAGNLIDSGAGLSGIADGDANQNRVGTSPALGWAIARDGTIYSLTQDGAFHATKPATPGKGHTSAANATTIAINIMNFAIAPDGSLYVLDRTGKLSTGNPAAGQPLTPVGSVQVTQTLNVHITGQNSYTATIKYTLSGGGTYTLNFDSTKGLTGGGGSFTSGNTTVQLNYQGSTGLTGSMSYQSGVYNLKLSYNGPAGGNTVTFSDGGSSLSVSGGGTSGFSASYSYKDSSGVSGGVGYTPAGGFSANLGYTDPNSGVGGSVNVSKNGGGCSVAIPISF